MPSELPKIAAIVADMDGTLLDTEFVAKTTWCQAASLLGFNLTDDVFHRLLGTNRADTNAILGQVFGPRFEPEGFYAECVRQTSLYIEANGMPVKSGARELLDWCIERRLPRAVATSANLQDAEAHLRHGKLRDYFDILISGDNVTKGKPDPEIFLKAAEALKVAPQQCLALEDSANGVRSAQAAGMVTFMVPDLVAPSDEIRALAHRVFPSLLDVRDYLQATLPPR